MTRTQSNGSRLYAATSPRHGRGVFAARRFRKGEVLERCPIISVSARDRAVLERTHVHEYLYECGRGAAIALGFGSLFNHSLDPNAECELLVDDESAVFRALRAIAEGEEITIRYADDEELWFVPTDDVERRRPGKRGQAFTRARRSRTKLR